PGGIDGDGDHGLLRARAASRAGTGVDGAGCRQVRAGGDVLHAFEVRWMAADGSVRLPVDNCDAPAGLADFAVRISVQSHGADRIAAGRASLTMDIFGEHPSIPIGIAILIAIYLGACRAADRKPTRRQAMWFAIAMGAILFTHTELDELADARLFSMHMLQHLMQTFVIPPLILLGTPRWMLAPWMLSRPIKPIARLLTNPVIAFLIFSAVFVTAHFPPIFDRMCRD